MLRSLSRTAAERRDARREDLDDASLYVEAEPLFPAQESLDATGVALVVLARATLRVRARHPPQRPMTPRAVRGNDFLPHGFQPAAKSSLRLAIASRNFDAIGSFERFIMSCCMNLQLPHGDTRHQIFRKI